MSEQKTIFVGKGEKPQHLSLKFANRHGLIAGATGTGKTVSLQILAEGFSAHGVPVFMADVKGDLSGICQPGKSKPKLMERADTIGLKDYSFQGYPTIFWDLFGNKGHPIRTTISEMGPLLLAQLLELNETQEGILNVVFKVADDQGLLLLDLKDLRAMLTFIGENASEFTLEYGNVSKSSVGAIQRRLLMLEQQGAKKFFGEPALDINDFMRTDENGQGYINLLAADQLMQHPRMYASFLLWMLAELFEELPEVGDQEKPKLVFFFDEAHLLFKGASKALVGKVEQVVRLIRSKGVGVYFITQNPLDIPESVLGQLGNRVQHALRAFTPKSQKAVRAAADTFRANPKFDAAETIMELGVGEALVSTLTGKGIPSVVQRTLIRPPSSRMGPITAKERMALFKQSPLTGEYDKAVDRDSAYEQLKERSEQQASEESKPPKSRRYDDGSARKKTGRSRRGNRQGVAETMAKSVVRSIGYQIGRQVVRGLMGSIFRGR